MNLMLGCTKRGVAIRSREMTAPHLRLHLECCVQLQGPQNKKYVGDHRDIWKASKMIRQQSSSPTDREHGMFRLLDRRLQGVLIVAFGYLKEAYKKEEKQLLHRETVIEKKCMVLNSREDFK